jgi:hypothetical protein
MRNPGRAWNGKRTGVKPAPVFVPTVGDALTLDVIDQRLLRACDLLSCLEYCQDGRIESRCAGDCDARSHRHRARRFSTVDRYELITCTDKPTELDTRRYSHRLLDRKRE